MLPRPELPPSLASRAAALRDATRALTAGAARRAELLEGLPLPARARLVARLVPHAIARREPVGALLAQIVEAWLAAAPPPPPAD